MSNLRSANIGVGVDYKGVTTGVQRIQGQLSGLSNRINKMSSTFKSMGMAIAGAFAVNSISGFVQDSISLASSMQGVERAFNNLTKSGDLEKLRAATKGMVSDLELMQQANFARSVGIEVQDLARVMSYVAKYARATGQSFSQLMNDATMEMIRQTGLRLDNIGLSVQSVKEAMGTGESFIGAMMKEIAISEARLGEGSATAAENFDQMRAAIQDAKVEIGQYLLPLVAKLAQAITPAVRELATYGRAAFGTMSSSDILNVEARAKQHAKIQRTAFLQSELNKEQEKYNELVKSQSFVITNEEYRERIRFKARMNAFRQELQMREHLANAAINQRLAELGISGGAVSNINPTGGQAAVSRGSWSKIAMDSKTTIGGFGSMTVDVKEFDAAMQELGNNLPTITKLWDDNLTQMQQRWEQFAMQVQMSVSDFMANSIYGLADALGQAMAGSNDAFSNFGQSMISAFGDFLSQMGKMFIAFGTAKIVMASALNPANLANPASGVALVAAGAAMAAIGGAIVASQNQFARSGTTSGGYGGSTVLESRVRGSDIVMVGNRYETKNRFVR